MSFGISMVGPINLHQVHLIDLAKEFCLRNNITDCFDDSIVHGKSQIWYSVEPFENYDDEVNSEITNLMGVRPTTEISIDVSNNGDSLKLAYAFSLEINKKWNFYLFKGDSFYDSREIKALASSTFP